MMIPTATARAIRRRTRSDWAAMSGLEAVRPAELHEAPVQNQRWPAPARAERDVLTKHVGGVQHVIDVEVHLHAPQSAKRQVFREPYIHLRSALLAQRLRH